MPEKVYEDYEPDESLPDCRPKFKKPPGLESSQDESLDAIFADVLGTPKNSPKKEKKKIKLDTNIETPPEANIETESTQSDTKTESESNDLINDVSMDTTDVAEEPLVSENSLDTKSEVQSEDNKSEKSDSKNSEGNKRPSIPPLMRAKQRILLLERNIERRYLKPPLNKSQSLNIPIMLSGANLIKGELDEDLPQGLLTWRRAVDLAVTASQLQLCVYQLNGSIAWEKSIMKVICVICQRDDNEAQLLLCDGCDKGYHTYCFRPKMENIPDGEWYCFECISKATGAPHCVVCGKRNGKLAECAQCPRAFHIDCLDPPLPRLPRKWNCPTCAVTKTKTTRGRKRRSKLNKDGADNSDECSSPEKKSKRDLSKLELSDEMNVCHMVMPDIEKHKLAWPFLDPVNTKQFPQYKKIIKTPMDFSTLKKKLREKIYTSRADFAHDVRLVFNNCELFNEDESEVGKAGHTLRKFFEKRWAELLTEANNSTS